MNYANSWCKVSDNSVIITIFALSFNMFCDMVDQIIGYNKIRCGTIIT